MVGGARRYAPEKIAAQIDVPAASIQRVAREFATRRPSVAIGDSRDVASLTAIYALNALVGAYRPARRDFCSAPTSERARAGCGARASASGAKPGAQTPQPEADIHGLIGAMGGSQVKALLVLDTNPALHAARSAQQLRKALANVPFIASFASFLDESSVMADLILPSHTTLERWVDDVPEPGVGFPVRTIGQPVVEPRWDTRDPGDVLIETAKALGGNAAGSDAVRKHGSRREGVVPLGARALASGGRRRLRGVLQEGGRCRRILAGGGRRPSPEPRAKSARADAAASIS